MCLAIPAKLVSCEAGVGLADLHGSRVEVSTLMVPEARAGDWVLVHAGFAIQVLDAAEAEATWELLRDLQEAVEGEDGRGSRE